LIQCEQSCLSTFFFSRKTEFEILNVKENDELILHRKYKFWVGSQLHRWNILRQVVLGRAERISILTVPFLQLVYFALQCFSQSPMAKPWNIEKFDTPETHVEACSGSLPPTQATIDGDYSITKPQHISQPQSANNPVSATSRAGKPSQ
jgi:hypothetical protein